jgi:tetratricopeptide (TPR) repeat protein
MNADMKKIASVILFLTLFSVPFISNNVKAAQDTVPAKSLILGVPYISWNDASQMEYEEKNVVNPALHAVVSMFLGYWEIDAQQASKGENNPTDNWSKELNSIESLDELKSFIAHGIPVIISPMPLTPYAHPLYVAFVAWGAINKEVGQPKQGLCSWMSGRTMAPLDWFDKYRESVGKGDFHPLGESLYIAPKIMVGYDDSRKVVILNDPTFGPGWEVDYDTFDKMWQAGGGGSNASHPPGYAEPLTKRKAQKPYRKRTANERAASHLLYGCGYSTVGRLEEAEDELAKGVALNGISKGYRHILHFELARHQAARNALDEAIKSAKAATKALSKNYYAWEYLADLYEMSGTGKKEQKAAKSARKIAQRTL